MMGIKLENRTIQILITAGICLFIAAALVQYWTYPPDFAGSHMMVTRRWLAGQTFLYDEQGAMFLNLPWMLGLIIPFASFPLMVGQFALYVLSLICIWVSIAIFWDRRHFSGAVLAGASLPVLFLLNNGQIEGVLLLGVTFSYLGVVKHKPLWLSAGLLILLIKPLNVLLFLLLLVWSVRRWQKREWWQMASLPLVALAISFVMAGLDWPLRYIQSVRETQSNTLLSMYVTIWRGAEYLGIPFWLPLLGAIVALAGVVYWVKREGFSPETAGLVLATNLTFTYYAMEYHHVLLIPAFLVIARSRWIAWFAYFLTFFAFARVENGFQVSWLMVAYPLGLLILIWLQSPLCKKSQLALQEI